MIKLMYRNSIFLDLEGFPRYVSMLKGSGGHEIMDKAKGPGLETELIYPTMRRFGN